MFNSSEMRRCIAFPVPCVDLDTCAFDPKRRSRHAPCPRALRRETQIHRDIEHCVILTLLLKRSAHEAFEIFRLQEVAAAKRRARVAAGSGHRRNTSSRIARDNRTATTRSATGISKASCVLLFARQENALRSCVDVAMDLRFTLKDARTRRTPRAPFRIENIRVQSGVVILFVNLTVAARKVACIKVLRVGDRRRNDDLSSHRSVWVFRIKAPIRRPRQSGGWNRVCEHD